MTAVPILDGAQASLELVVDAHARLGEGPRWDPRASCLWWVDILGGRIHRFDPDDGRDRVTAVDGLPGAVALRADGGLIVALDDRVAAMADPDDGRLETVISFAVDPALRSNDAGVDPAGRLWIDRMGRRAEPGRGALVRVDPDRTIHRGLSGLTIPNGIDWSPDGRSMYYVDSDWREVRVFAYDGKTGTIGEGRTLVRLPDDGLPDGIAVDAEGCIWVAHWGASRVLRVSPEGEILGAVRLPVSQVTACAFGGADLDDLYITTATEDFGPDDHRREPQAGGLWRCHPGPPGRVSTPFAG